MPTFIELCSGAGGLSSGLINAGFMPLLLNDNNRQCCETLRINHPNIRVLHKSICDIYDEDLDEYMEMDIDLIAGGIPCQSYSTIGARRGLEDCRGELINDFARIVAYLQPKMFLIENVKGLLIHNKGETFTKFLEIIHEITDSRYNIKYKLLNAVDYEVPQKRERVFIIGILNDLDIDYKFPIACENRKVLRDALEDVPESDCAKYNEKLRELYEYIPEGGCWIDLPENLQKEYMKCSYNSGGGKRGILKRLEMSKPSLTILCSPIQKQSQRCHPYEIRPLTIRESARIQTFPDSYQFCGSLTAQYKQIGNAVPVKLAEYIGKSIINVL